LIVSICAMKTAPGKSEHTAGCQKQQGLSIA
jgi:hypothetical protein